MDMVSIISKRRDGLRHDRAELVVLAEGAASGSIPDYQLSAWLMAAFLNPLNEEETAWLTLAMAESGERIDLTGLPKPWVDKHSTGGVGDKTTLVLLPLLASCGLTVVKMSGRGLGITGGTIDKLSAVPGFRLDLTPDEMKEQAKRIGLAITGASPSLAPADKVLYALRDTTGTTRSIPLLVSSILCKKIAGGADTVVLDVKCGSGAFMTTLDGARALADMLVKTANRAGLKTRVAITDMGQPMGSAIGNAVEVAEAIDVLRKKPDEPLDAPRERFRRLCLEFAGLTLEACGAAENHEAGRKMAEEAVASGRAYDKLGEWFKAQGFAGDPATFDDEIQRARFEQRYEGPTAWVQRFDAGVVGRVVIDLGGGRKKKEDPIDVGVGVVSSICVGQKVEPGDLLFTVFGRTPQETEDAARRVLEAIEFSPSEVPAPPLVIDVL
jgi:pyrimidine-nucleoside phosphorylase